MDIRFSAFCCLSRSCCSASSCASSRRSLACFLRASSRVKRYSSGREVRCSTRSCALQSPYAEDTGSASCLRRDLSLRYSSCLARLTRSSSSARRRACCRRKFSCVGTANGSRSRGARRSSARLTAEVRISLVTARSSGQ